MTSKIEVKDVKPSGGMIFYPQSYVIDKDSDYSYAKGVNELGHPCVFYLNPDEGARERAKDSDTAQSIPTFAEFSDTRKRATRSCYADPSNNPANPVGVLLMEQVAPFEKPYHEHDTPVYTARWASILRDSEEMPRVPIGYGYLEINTPAKVGDDINEYMQRYKDIEADMEAGLIDNLIEADEEKQRLYKLILTGRKKWFVAVILKHRMIKQIEDVSVLSITDAIKPYLEGFTKSGMYGGVIIRSRKDGVILPDLTYQCDMQYDYANSQVMNVNDVIANFFKFGGTKLIRAVNDNPDIIVDIIPTQRINCGKLGNNKYSLEIEKQGATAKIMKAYVDRNAHSDPVANYKKNKQFLYCKVAVRPAEIYREEDRGNILVSAIHAFSAPIGNVLSINEKGEPEYKMPE